jgi:hypothetical protein
VALARFSAENLAVQSAGLAASVTEGAESVLSAPLRESAA